MIAVSSIFPERMYKSLVHAIVFIPASLVVQVLMIWFILETRGENFEIPISVIVMGVVFLFVFHVVLHRVARFKNRCRHTNDQEAFTLTTRTSWTLLVYYVSHFLFLICGIILTTSPHAFVGCYLTYYLAVYLRMVLLVEVCFEPDTAERNGRSPSSNEVFPGSEEIDPEYEAVNVDESGDGDTLRVETRPTFEVNSSFGNIMFRSLLVSLYIIPSFVFVGGILGDGTLGAPIALMFSTVAFFWCIFHLILVRVAIDKNRQAQRATGQYKLSLRMSLFLVGYYMCVAIFFASFNAPITSATEASGKLVPILATILLGLVFCEPTA